MTNYDTEVIRYDLPPLVRSKKSPDAVNRQVIEHIEEIKKHPDMYVYSAVTDTLRKYKIEFQLLFEAYELLGRAELENLEYNNEAMKAKLIDTSNKNAEAKLRLKLIQAFELNEPITNKRYTNVYIKNKIQEFYDELGIRKTDGSPEKAKANHLERLGLFEVRECKVKDEHGVEKPGRLIWRVNYTLKQVA